MVTMEQGDEASVSGKTNATTTATGSASKKKTAARRARKPAHKAAGESLDLVGKEQEVTSKQEELMCIFLFGHWFLRVPAVPGGMGGRAAAKEPATDRKIHSAEVGGARSSFVFLYILVTISTRTPSRPALDI
jgi:hypothetical protein